MEHILTFTNDPNLLIRKARNGILKKELQKLQVEIELNDKELTFALQVDIKQWENISPDQQLNLYISERAILLTQLYASGYAVLGKENFLSWMNKKHIALGKLKPKEYLDTYFGIELLLQELGRIKHGVLA